jgi:hypothetical protein
MTYWVVDTCVIESSNNSYCTEYIDCVSLLMRIKDSDGICLDAYGEIENEYEPYLRTPLTQKWWQIMRFTQGKVYTCSHHLYNRHVKKLDEMKFHDDDLKFVGTAFNSPDRKIITHDSDYRPEIVDYLSKNCNIDVIHPCRCYNARP